MPTALLGSLESSPRFPKLQLVSSPTELSLPAKRSGLDKKKIEYSSITIWKCLIDSLLIRQPGTQFMYLSPVPGRRSHCPHSGAQSATPACTQLHAVCRSHWHHNRLRQLYDRRSTFDKASRLVRPSITVALPLIYPIHIALAFITSPAPKQSWMLFCQNLPMTSSIVSSIYYFYHKKPL